MHICIISAGIEMGVIDLGLQGYLAISTQNFKKRYSTSLLYSDLGRPKGVTRPKLALVQIKIYRRTSHWNARDHMKL